MVHPFSSKDHDIIVILEICTTYKGVPFGPAVINYKDPEKKDTHLRELVF